MIHFPSLRSLTLSVTLLAVNLAWADPVAVKASTNTKNAADGAKAHDGDEKTGWAADGSITFQFERDRYLGGVVFVAAGTANATLITPAGVRKDVAISAGKSATIDLSSVQASSLTLELRPAAGFQLLEVSFSDAPSPSVARPTLSAKSSSVLENKPKQYGPALAVDGNLATAWNEGAKGAKGEWLEIGFDKPAFVQHMGVVVGYSKYNPKIGEVWFKNHRVKQARIDYGNGWYYEANFEDRFDFQYVPVRMVTKSARITIKDVYPTLKFEDTPISEVRFVYEYVDEVKLETSFDQDITVKSDAAPRYLVARVKGAYTLEGERPASNVVLVIDQSGSMSEDDRMLHARESAKLIVGTLGPADSVALISFDDNIYVRSEPVKATAENKAALVKTIETLVPQGSTNIHGALTKAMELAEKNRSEKVTSRVLLLSDGEPTAGIKDPVEIAAVAGRVYEQKAVVTSTFGLGPTYNEDLMAKVATASKGAFYHITTPAQMFKVFGTEMAALTRVLGRSPVLTIDAPKGVEIGKIYGYEATPKDGRVEIKLPPISAADEQKVVLEVKAKGTWPDETQVVATLEYLDATSANEKRSLKSSRVLTGGTDAAAAKGSRNAPASAEVLATLGAVELDGVARSYATGGATTARAQLHAHIEKLKQENVYLKSEALLAEIATLEAIEVQMQADANSNEGKLAVKEAKATAQLAVSKSYAGTSLNEATEDPKTELRRLLATNFPDTQVLYGAEPIDVVAKLVAKGAPKAEATSACNSMGFRAYQAKDYDKALAWFDAALVHDPAYVLSIYNAACTWGLKKDAAKAVSYLGRLKGLSDPAAKKRLEKTKKDTDFDLVRTDKAFVDFMATVK